MENYLQNTGTVKEKAEFDELIQDSSNEALLLSLLEDKWKLNDFSPKEINQSRSSEILKNIIESDIVDIATPAETVRMIPWWRISVAIILILLCVTGAYLYFSSTENAIGDSFAKKENVSEDVLPGTHSATLQFSDKRKIKLKGISVANLGKEGNVALGVVDEALEYSTTLENDHNPAGERYNTLSTANGQNYALKLSEGTKVWLNAGSSITYPVSFTGKYRSVQITGEVEFEVTKNAAMPFSVEVSSDKKGQDLTVQVLGTHFTINAYPGESTVKTILLEGSVLMISGSRQLKIKPGQQGSLDSTGELEVKDLPNADKTADLKSGLFSFKNDDIKSVLRDIARWYDVELVYEGNIKATSFSGSIQKSLSLNAVIKKLDTYVHLKIEDKKLIVTQ
ncbi:MAG: FecR family protein [Chitinophagaceae bacterium]